MRAKACQGMREGVGEMSLLLVVGSLSVRSKWEPCAVGRWRHGQEFSASLAIRGYSTSLVLTKESVSLKSHRGRRDRPWRPPQGMCSESYPRQAVRGEIEKITPKPKSVPKGVEATAFSGYLHTTGRACLIWNLKSQIFQDLETS